MAKTPEPVAVPTAPAPDSEPKLSIQEFCVRLSETVRRPEMIGAFHRVETAAARNSDTAGAYRERFDAFTNQPV